MSATWPNPLGSLFLENNSGSQFSSLAADIWNWCDEYSLVRWTASCPICQVTLSSSVVSFSYLNQINWLLAVTSRDQISDSILEEQNKAVRNWLVTQKSAYRFPLLLTPLWTWRMPHQRGYMPYSLLCFLTLLSRCFCGKKGKLWSTKTP